MKVVFLDAVTNPKKPGVAGLSDITWRLAYELTNLGIEVSVIGLYQKDAAPPFPNINFIRISPPRKDRQNILTVLRERATLVMHAKQVHDERAVFHVSDTLSAGYLSLMGLGRRTIWQGHSNLLHNSRHGNPWDRSTYLSLRLFTKFAARSIRYVIAFGPSLVYWWEKSGFKTDSIIVIPNGIDPDFNLFEIQETNLPRDWLTKENKILYVGRLAKDKGGHIELLNCLQSLNRHHANFALLIIGDGPLRGKLEAFTRAHNNTSTIFFLGRKPQSFVNFVYPLADLLVLPSKNEMMPRVMLEAWAHGVAFMGTDVGAVGDYLIDEYNGYLLSDWDPKNLAQRVTLALEDQDKRKRIIENGRSEVEKFSWSIIAKKYQRLYNVV